MESFQKTINRLPKKLVNKIKETKQNPKYHPEISLYNHLWMVYDNIKKSIMSLDYKTDMLICAIFHDLGKIDCSFEKTIKDGSKHIVSYGHENYAKDYLDKYLHLYEYYDKNLIYKVCANHMRAHLYDKMRESKKEKFRNYKYFSETMEFSSFDSMSKQGYPYFIMTIGIPGSGKSSWMGNFIQDINNELGIKYEIVCPDQIRKEITGDISNITQDGLVWKLTKERVIEYLKSGKNVILDATNTISKYRKKFIEDLPLCFRYAKIFECDPEIAKQRIKNDIENKIDRSHVPNDIINKMYDQFKKDFDKINEDGFEII